MKESEARTKACPHFHAGHIIVQMTTVIAAINSDSPLYLEKLQALAEESDSLCIGSDCMMWDRQESNGYGDCRLKK